MPIRPVNVRARVVEHAGVAYTVVNRSPAAPSASRRGVGAGVGDSP